MISTELAWRRAMANIINDGARVEPRGLPCLEVLHGNPYQIDMKSPVIAAPLRKLSYQFMAAEALWIATGDNALAPLVKHAPHYARFSDDGLTLAGAYGPPFVAQLPWLVDKLVEDRDTRQASLTLWNRCPPPSRDIPCTMAMNFSIRGDELHLHAFMRSSDAWLGLPYDTFSFSAMAAVTACRYNTMPGVRPVSLGLLTISMASSHLYLSNLARAREVLMASVAPPVEAEAFPAELIRDGDTPRLRECLEAVRDQRTDATWGVAR